MYTVKQDELEVAQKEKEADAYNIAAQLAMIHVGSVFTVWKDSKKIGTLVGKPDGSVANKVSSLNTAVFNLLRLTSPSNLAIVLERVMQSSNFTPHRTEDIN
jgi:hypothetical protein